MTNPDDLIKRSDVFNTLQKYFDAMLTEGSIAAINSIPAARSDKGEAVAWGYVAKDDHVAYRTDIINNWKPENKTRMTEPLFTAPQQAIPADAQILIDALHDIAEKEQTLVRMPQPNMMVNSNLPKIVFSYVLTARKALSDYLSAAPTAPIDNVREALERLVKLKLYKDKNGKDEYYEKEQPAAWIEAIRVLMPYWIDTSEITGALIPSTQL